MRPIKEEANRTLDAMSKDERSLLLYLEARAVDNGGRVAGAHMNVDDVKLARVWAERGFIRFSRMLAAYVGEGFRACSFVVELSPFAWACAGFERRRRSERQQADEVRESLEHHEAQALSV